MLKPEYCKNILNLLFGFETSEIENAQGEKSCISRAREYKALQRAVFGKQWSKTDIQKLYKDEDSILTGGQLADKVFGVPSGSVGDRFTGTMLPKLYDDLKSKTFKELNKNTHNIEPPTYYNLRSQKLLIYTDGEIRDSKGNSIKPVIAGTNSTIFQQYVLSTDFEGAILFGLTPTMAATAEPSFLEQWETMKNDIIQNSYYHTVYECDFIQEPNAYDQSRVFTPWYIVLDYTKWSNAYQTRLQNFSMPSTRYLGYAQTNQTINDFTNFLNTNEAAIRESLNDGILWGEPEAQENDYYARYYLDYDSITGEAVLGDTPSTGQLANYPSDLNIYLSNKSTIYFPTIPSNPTSENTIIGVGLFTHNGDKANDGCYMFMPLEEAVPLQSERAIMPIIRKDAFIVGFLNKT